VIHTPNFQLMVPEVIMLQRYGKIPKHYVKFNRRNICHHDNFTCQYCGKSFPREELTIDHVAPRSRGGASTCTNVVLAPAAIPEKATISFPNTGLSSSASQKSRTGVP